MQHDAFISYNHAADQALAKALEEGMEKLAKPLLSLRAIDVFRDETGLAASPNLWDGIIDHLTGTKWLIVLACPEWANSYWCRREALWWLDNHSADRMLIALIGGELAWDRARGDFDWSLTTALSKELSGRFREEPLYVDLRWARGQEGLTLSNLGFRDAVLNLSATIRGVAKDQLDGADVRQLRRNRRLVRAGVTAIAISAIVAIWQAIVATHQRDEAVRQAQIARSRELAAASRLETRNTDLGIFLAAKAYRTSPTSEALVALRGVLSGSALRMVLSGHTQGLTDASFSPDGRLALTASLDGSARLWDAGNGRLLKILSGHSMGLNHASFSPKGSYIVTSGGDGSAKIWKAPSGDLVCDLKHTASVRGADFSPDETRIVTAGLDRMIAIWDVPSCSRSAELSPLPKGAAQVSFSNDGRKVLAAGFDDNSRVWDADNGTLLATLRHPSSNFAVFSPDGFKVVTSGLDESPMLWDITDAKPAPKSLGHYSLGGNRAAFSADGRFIVVGGVRPAARIFDAATAKPITEWLEAPADLDPIDAANPGFALAAFSPDGSQVLTQVGTTLRVWDVASRRRIALFRGHAKSVQSAAFSPDGLQVISSSFDGTARIWKAGAARTIAQLGELGGPLEHSTFSYGGQWLAAATRENGVRLWRVDEPDHPRVLRSDTRMFQTVALSADTTRIVAQTTPYAEIWDSASGQVLGTLRHNIVDAITFPQFSSDGSQIIAGSATRANVWRTDNGANVLELSGHTDAVMHAAISTDGKRALTASKDGTARIWDTATGTTLHALTGHSGPVSFVAFSPDGLRVATASWDYTARVWDVVSGQPQAVLAGHSRPLSYAGFSPDGQWIVTLGDDQTARIWDSATGQELASFVNSAEGLLAAAFLPENDRVIVLTRSGKLVVLTCELCTTPDVLLRFAVERVSGQPTPDEVRRYHLEPNP